MKKIIHIDMSGKFYKLENVGIAYVSANDKKDHKGSALHSDVIKSLVKEYQADQDFARLYAIWIYLIINKEIDNFSQIIICNDENFSYVKEYLYLLFEDGKLNEIKIYPIDYYRGIIGRKVNSLANGRADSYRKRGLKPHLWSKGTVLNVIKIEYKNICDCWKKIDDKLKKKSEG